MPQPIWVLVQNWVLVRESESKFHLALLVTNLIADALQHAPSYQLTMELLTILPLTIT